MKKIGHITFIFLMVSSSIRAFTMVADSIHTDSVSYAPEMTITNIDTLLITAKGLAGIRYKYGGTTKKGFDCSGFLKYVMEASDVPFPRTAAEQYCLGNEVIGLDSAKVGDLIFFKPRNRANRVGHVGMISRVEDDQVYMIHASSSAGIKEINYSHSSYFKSRIVGIKRWWF